MATLLAWKQIPLARLLPAWQVTPATLLPKWNFLLDELVLLPTRTLPSHARIPLSLPLSTHAHAAASSPFTSHLRRLRSCRTDEPRIPPCCHREKPSLNAVACSSSSSRLHHRPCNACPCGLGSATPSSLPWTPVHAALAPPPSLVLAQQLG
ncbi:hypothetical protein BDA96_08G091700 [Sorghum bicolor]|uniref:Uncharacterized protein n=1 Tax=Sorghum bicolor TaxID=4558 RepID=A0A921U706_SORBI|nr:hypothetical protein BDA96_08G091700 [Sorghum bicolor]